MPDDIPFDKNLDLAPDTVDEPMPGVRRVMADNPGIMAQMPREITAASITARR